MSEPEIPSNYAKLERADVHNGVLCRLYWEPGGLQSIMQVIVPDALRDEILAELHRGALGGHLGVDKTLTRLKERFYWPGHHNDVQNWWNLCIPIDSCSKCSYPTDKDYGWLPYAAGGYGHSQSIATISN